MREREKNIWGGGERGRKIKNQNEIVLIFKLSGGRKREIFIEIEENILGESKKDRENEIKLIFHELEMLE
jgi:hypothetical protein